MAISLEELRRQREQIQKHLDWLDATIAAEAAEHEVPLEDESRAQAEAPVSSKAPVAHAVPDPTATSGGRQGSAPDTADDEHADPAQPEFKARTTEELNRAKIGCIALFLLATTLFLFLLFGLPYLL